MSVDHSFKKLIEKRKEENGVVSGRLFVSIESHFLKTGISCTK